MADFGIQPSLANSSRERESDKVEYVMIDHDLWSWVMWFFVGPSLWQSLPSLGKDSSLPPTPINQKLNRYLNSNSLFLWFTKTFTGKKTEIYLHEIEHSFQTLSSKQNYISAWVWMLQSLPISSFVGKINAKWGNNPFVTQQVGANLTTTGGGIKMFTHLVFDWFQYNGRKENSHITSIFQYRFSSEFCCINSFWTDRMGILPFAKCLILDWDSNLTFSAPIDLIANLCLFSIF